AARQLPEGYTTPYPDSTVKEKFSLNALIGVSATINLAISNGDAYVLAAPKLSARSGGKAKFLAGGEIPLKSVGRDGLATIIFKKYGILLDLEANVIGADGISGGVAAEVSSVDYANKVEGLPGFLIRRTESEFNMRDGETLVLSGLIDKANSRIVDKVPLLGNLPIIGEFFRNKQIAGQDSELVVFITPHIYSAQSEINRRAIERGTNGLNKYGTSLGDGNVATDYVEVNKVGPSKQSKQSDNAPAEMKEPASAKE
ncbi:MAG: type II and III secretion system protein, partial [Pseudomonadota bacterium]